MFKFIRRIRKIKAIARKITQRALDKGMPKYDPQSGRLLRAQLRVKTEYDKYTGIKLFPQLYLVVGIKWKWFEYDRNGNKIGRRYAI